MQGRHTVVVVSFSMISVCLGLRIEDSRPGAIPNLIVLRKLERGGFKAYDLLDSQKLERLRSKVRFCIDQQEDGPMNGSVSYQILLLYAHIMFQGFIQGRA